MNVQLNISSQYSLLESTLSIDQIIQLAKKANLEAICLSDYLNMTGCFEFYRACESADLKAIFGIHIDFKHEQHVGRVQLIAKNQVGFKNLLKISTMAAFSKEPLGLQELFPLRDGIAFLISDSFPSLISFVLQNKVNQCQDIFLAVKEVFDETYLALSSRGSAGQLNVKNQLRKLCAFLNIDCIVAGQISYISRENTKLSHILSAIKEQRVISFEQLNQLHEFQDDYLHDDSFYEQMFTKQEILNTYCFADSISVKLEHFQNQIIPFTNRLNISSDQYLRALCLKGLNRRFDSNYDSRYLSRLEYELSIISQMQFADYFLIVYDYVLFAKKQNIMVGDGRGSVTGSLVAYVLGITQVDPIKYNLFFERFLNPQRTSMPDIDIDFADEDREKVIEYVANKYGREHVCHIMTYGTMKAKMALRDVARVFEINSYQIDMLIKTIPNVLNITLDEAYNNSVRLRNVLIKYPDLQLVYNYAKQLENLVRHISTHAAGIILARDKLSDLIALQPGLNQTAMAQHTMYDLEKIGLLKMDFLGLRNLTIIDNILKMIESRQGIKIELNKIDLNDKKTLDLISKGDTDGVFQLESTGMKQLLVKVKVSKFSDIYACNALFRPGPMDNIDSFIRRKHGLDPINYDFEELEPILQETYGIIVYQEQIMQIVQTIAGFSLADADLVRKAMSKKNPTKLKELKQNFVNNAIQLGHSKEKVERLYDLILRFSNYGFNKGHSVAYSLIAFQMAYLKANFPLEFMSCVLSKMIGSENKINDYLSACHRYNIQVLPPSLNYSDDTFKIENQALRYPLTAVKGIGHNAYLQIINQRNQYGPFKDPIDAIVRLNFAKISKRLIETLIEAGAFDDLYPKRASLLASLNIILHYAHLIEKVENHGQLQLDESIVKKPTLLNVYENTKHLLTLEYNALGLYLSMHPTCFYEQKITISQCYNLVGQVVECVLLIDYIKQIRTKKGQLMAFASASDQTGKINLTFLPIAYGRYNNFIQKEHVVKIYGKIEYGNELSILVNKVEGIDKIEVS